MVRKCVVRDCSQSDQTILSHRFPKGEKQVLLWQQILRIGHIPICDLHAKYVVCTLHFMKSDYRNPVSKFLNSTAKPIAPPLTEDEMNEVVEDSQQEEEEECFGELIDVEPSEELDLESDKIDGTEIDVEMMVNSNIIEVDTLDGFTRNRKKKQSNVIEEEPQLLEEDQQQEAGMKRMRLDEIKQPETNTVILFGDLLKNYHMPNDELQDFVSVEEEEHLADEYEENDRVEYVQPIELQTKTNISEPQNLPSPPSPEQHEDEGEFTGVPRKELIQRISDQDEKIKELEEKLDKIQSAQLAMTKSMEAFKNLFNTNI